MLLTSWLRSFRQTLQTKRVVRRAKRRKRSLPRCVVEALEDRTLLSSLVIDTFTPGVGINLTNSDLDIDGDNVADFDTVVIDSVAFSGDGGLGVSITLSDLAFDSLTIDSLSITGTGGAGITITLDNVALDALIIENSSIDSTVGGGVDITLRDTQIADLTIFGTTISAGAGTGLDISLDSQARNSVLGKLDISQTTVDGVRISATGTTGSVSDASNDDPLRMTSAGHGLATDDPTGDRADPFVVITDVQGNLAANISDSITVIDDNTFDLDNTNGTLAGAYMGGGTWTLPSIIRDVSIRENTITGTGTTGGLGFVLVDSQMPQLVIEDNPSLRGISFDLTRSPIDGALIRDNADIQADLGHGIGLTLDRSSLTGFVIENNTISGNGSSGGGGVVIDATDSNLDIWIQDNTITDTIDDGIRIDTTVTDTFVADNGGPMQIDLSPLANEVQKIELVGDPTGGTFTLTFNGETTAALPHDALPFQIEAALEALSNIQPGDVRVTGGPLPSQLIFVEFRGNLGRQDVTELVPTSALTGGVFPEAQVTTVTEGNADQEATTGGIRGNMITNNDGAGVQINLTNNTALDLTLAANTISSNDAGGFAVMAADSTPTQSVTFDLVIGGSDPAMGNTFDGNGTTAAVAPAVAITMLDTALGAFNIQNNTI
ncbi:MAG TPA: hypothetical protein EYP14_02950, partial [Planctomycetaceae bacterium]|nr:hypothetical protein [Planctomycetaceae bacterium]